MRLPSFQLAMTWQDLFDRAGESDTTVAAIRKALVTHRETGGDSEGGQ